MFTLPVTTRSLILSKVLSALIISCGTMLVIGILGGEIVALSPLSLRNTVAHFGNWIIKVNVGPWIGYGTIFAIVALLSSIYHVYTAMVIGQLSNNNRFLFAFIAYVGIHSDLWIYLIENIVLVIIYHIITEILLTKKLNLE